MLYRQIIMLQGIPFQATIPAPLTREEMDDATFDAIMRYHKSFSEVAMGDTYGCLENLEFSFRR